MQSINDFKKLKSQEMRNVHGGDFVHTSYVFFGIGVEDVFQDNNDNGVYDDGDAAFTLLSVSTR